MNLKRMEEKVEAVKKMLDPDRAKREKAKERKKGIAKGLALGTFIGGLVGVFYAPDKGENTRKKAKEELEKAKEILENNIIEGKEKLGDFVEDKKEVFNEKMILVKEKVNAKADVAVAEDAPEEEEEADKK